MLSNEPSYTFERERLARLASYKLVRRPSDPTLDQIINLAAEQFNVPMAYISIAEENCHWLKASVGIGLEEVPRSISFCDYTMKCEGLLVLKDASRDARFCKNPFVTGPASIRFYAGYSFRDADGFVLGTLAVADTIPRNFSVRQQNLLRGLADIIRDRMDLNKAKAELRESTSAAETARQRAVAGEAKLKKVIDCLPQALVLVNQQNELALWNSNYEKMWPDMNQHFRPGVNFEDIHRLFLRNENYHEAKSPKEEDEWIRERMALVENGTTIVERNEGDGRWIRYDHHLTEDGEKICVRTDITDDIKAAESFRLLFESNPVPMWVVEKDTLKFVDVNSAALAHYGYSREQFLAMTSFDIRPERERQRALDDAKNNFSFDNNSDDWVHLKADGSEILVSSFAMPITYKNTDAAIVAVVDVTERRRQDAHIKYLADHDVLTGLPNRRFFLQLLGQSFENARKLNHHQSIILVDIDKFKEINDTFGHYVGDNLIEALARKLEECVGNRGIVARLGGDEFAVLLPKLVRPEQAQEIGMELVRAFDEPLKIQEYEILVGISVGVGVSIAASLDASTLLKNADLAVYRAKSDGRGVCRVYEPQMGLQLILRREIEQDLRHALANEEFIVQYQELVGLQGAHVVGFEALVRWRHPSKGMVAPSDFIPIAESSGMIVPIGAWVLDQACAMAIKLKDHLSVAVNVSPAQFKAGDLVATVRAALGRSGLNSERLEIEITESSLLENSVETVQILNGLRELGVKIVLDDFGTGYSGLGYLNSFQFDKIKIDRSFVRDIGTRKKSEELVRAAVNIGQSLQITTLAEGIETKAQF